MPLKLRFTLPLSFNEDYKSKKRKPNKNRGEDKRGPFREESLKEFQCLGKKRKTDTMLGPFTLLLTGKWYL